MRFRLALIAAFLVTPLAGGAVVGQQRQAPQEQRVERLGSLDALMMNFDRMAFGEEGERAKWAAVQRWRQPVRAILIGDATDAYRDEVRAVFADFAALTGVPFTLTDGDSQANLRIFFSQREWYRGEVARSFPRPNAVVCFTNTTVYSGGAIGMATTVIPEDLNSRTVRVCLVHELMHAIGFQGHPMRSFDSALRNGIGFDRMTVNDRILIRAMYDERLRPDMTSEEALGIARDVVAELLAKVQAAEDPMDVLAQRSRSLQPPPWNGGPV